MNRLSRIIKDYTEAGSVNSHLAVWGFVDDATFITKAGDVGVVFRVAGVDAEACEHQTRRDIVHRFEAALRPLDERFTVYEYLIKSRVPPFTAPPCAHPVAAKAIQRRTDDLNSRRDTLYGRDLFLVLLMEGPAPRGGAWFSQATVTTLVEADLTAAIKRLHHAAAAAEIALADSIRPTRLDRAEVFRFLRRLVNYAPHKVDAPLRHDTHLDYFVADSAVECQRDHLLVDNRHVAVLAMKDPPGYTFAHVLAQLQHVPGEYIACLEWHRIPVTVMRKDLMNRKKHFFSGRRTITPSVGETTHPDDQLLDDSADASMTQIGAALREMEEQDQAFGECSLTMVFYDRDQNAVEEAVAGAVKTLAAVDGQFVAETYNVLNAWLAIMPGNYAHNLRRMPLSSSNVADISFLFTHDRGQPINAHLQAPALAVLETANGTPYSYNLHHEDVGHTLVLGSPGSGKSFATNFMLTHAQQYDPFVVVFDRGHSYRNLAGALGGSYLELGMKRQAVRMNPFALPFTPENLNFFHAFVRVLLETKGSDPLTEREDRELYEAIEALAVYEPSQRRLFSLTLPGPLQRRLAKWTETGRYPLFDHEEDTLSLNRFQVFEFDEMSKYPELLEPLLFYILHRVSAQIGERLTLCVLDEAWRFIQHPVLCAYVRDALKTWRKKNAAMWLATQTLKDFESADLLRTVVESCRTKLLFWNPAFDRAEYADKLQLNEMELDLAAGLIEKRQVLMKRPDVSKVLTLNVDPESARLYAHDSAAALRLTA